MTANTELQPACVIRVSDAANNIAVFAQISPISDEKQELGNIAGFQRLLVVVELFLAYLVFSCIFELAGVA